MIIVCAPVAMFGQAGGFACPSKKGYKVSFIPFNFYQLARKIAVTIYILFF